MSGFIEQVFILKRKYKGVVFLDRDGTLIEWVDYLNSQSQLKLLPGVIEGIKLFNKKNIAVIIVTNQPVVARGIISIRNLKKINKRLFETLKNEGAFIDAIYSCPHHPEKNHKDIPIFARKFRINCKCRKPGLAMFKKAISKYNSTKIIGVIGDQNKDILAGRKLKTKTVLISKKNRKIKNESKTDSFSTTFLDAVKIIFWYTQRK